MNASLGFGSGHTLNAVHAGFIFQFRIRTFAFDFKDDFLVTADADGTLRHDLALPAFALCVTRIHAEQICRKQRGFIAACSGADFDDHVLFIARIFGNEQPFNFFFECFDLRSQIG